MRGTLKLSTVLSVLALAAPAAASADTTYCVPSASIDGCPAGATAESTVTAAFAAVNADSNTARDTVRIGPGSFPGGGLSTAHPVSVVGAGAASTTITGTATSPTLALSNGSAAISGLTVDGPSSASATGLSLAGAATGVDVSAPAASTGAVGVSLSGSFVGGTVSVPSSGTGIAGANSATVGHSTITAGTGFSGAGTVSASRITATVGATGTQFLPLTIDDSLIETRAGTAPEVAIDAAPSEVTARHDTLIGDGASGSTAVVCTASGGILIETDSSVTLDSAIVRGFARSAYRAATGGTAAPAEPGAQASANLTVEHSDIDPATAVNGPNTPGQGYSDPNDTFLSAPGGSASGQITLGSGNLDVDPKFAGTSAGEPYALTRPSPVIDQGDPSPGSRPAEPTTDLAGAPRAVAGHAGAAAVSDMGAFEYQPAAPTLTVSAAPGQPLPGQAVTFTAAPADSDPTDGLAVAWRFDDGVTATGATTSHAFSALGRHTATATVTDSGGYTASATVTVTVIQPPGPPPGAHPAKPALSEFKVSPASFKAKSGATVSWRDSVAAKATLTVLRPVKGYVSGRKCVAKAPKHRRGARLRRCTLWSAVGSVAHADAAGTNRVHLAAKVGRHKLGAGAYELSLVARDSAGSSKVLSARFRVR